MLRLLVQMRSRNPSPDVRECLAAFNRSERERLLPVFRRCGPRIFFISVVLLCLLLWGAAVYWEIHR
jgi:hypothetical protein